MDKYRVKIHSFATPTIQYEIQKKSIFGFWYNPDNVDAYTTGFFDTSKEAEYCIESKIVIK